MRQHPSLDVIAAQRSRHHSPNTATATDDASTSRPADDSRSSSSTSSPAPVDNEESDFFLGANDSQSSLGVPNLQDMQVTDDECLPPINRLPNEILIAIFSKLSQASDVLHCMLTCKRWARNSVDILWHRPACTTWEKHSSICQTLGFKDPYFAYRDFIKRLNLAALADKVNDGSVMALAVCTRVERLTLTSCKGLTDSGLIALVENNNHLLALDISGDEQITEASIYVIAEHCRRLQGLNMSNCRRISPDSMVKLAENCRFIKRLKLNDCPQLTDEAILAFAEHCPNILEIDLQQCRLIGNDPVTTLFAKGQSLRELRLVNCELIDDGAFLSLPPNKTYESLRILDLTSCARVTDRAVEKIIDMAPRLRNLILAKCRNITDAAVFAISRLGKNLHYIHLGHCGHITDESVKRLVQCCNRIRYIDLGCCVHLTDDSVTRLATLPKLKRIGLVKCASITDDSVYALAKANQRLRPRRDVDGNITLPPEHYTSSHSSLERVHLSYCTNLTLKSILKLLNSCPRLTHLSLTGVHSFLREDLERFCRDAPPEFTEHQRQVFCVFSGQGVVGLRRYLNSERDFANLQEPVPGEQMHQTAHPPPFAGPVPAPPPLPLGSNPGEGPFDEGEPDVVDDDDGIEDGSEMAIDTQPLLGTNHPVGLGVGAPDPMGPQDQPEQAAQDHFPQLVDYQQAVPHQVRFHEDPMAFPQVIPSPGLESDDGADGHDAMDISPADLSNPGASTAGLGSRGYQSHASSSRETSGAGRVAAEIGPSTTSLQRQPPQRGRSPTPFQVVGYQDQSPSTSNGNTSGAV